MEVYGFTDEELVLARTLLKHGEGIDSGYPLLHRVKPKVLPYDGSCQGYNVVLIIMESFRAMDVGVLGGQHHVTPCFDALSRKGVLFERYYTSGIQTARALVSLECSLPAYYGQRILHRSKRPAFFSLGRLLTNHGYRYGFHTGSSGHYDNQRDFYQAQGADQLVCDEDLSPDLPRFSWGVHDRESFLEALKRLSKRKEPFGATLLSCSNHQPYRFGQWPEGSNDFASSFRAAMRYSDAALGEFFEKAQKEDFYKRTLFIITADTGQDFTSNGGMRARIGLREAVMHVPLLLLTGDGKLAPERRNDLCSHPDVLPTIARLLGLMPAAAPW